MGPDSGAESSPVTISGDCTQTCQGFSGLLWEVQQFAGRTWCNKHSIYIFEKGLVWLCHIFKIKMCWQLTVLFWGQSDELLSLFMNGSNFWPDLSPELYDFKFCFLHLFPSLQFEPFISYQKSGATFLSLFTMNSAYFHDSYFHKTFASSNELSHE